MLKGHWKLIETKHEADNETQWSEVYYLAISKDRFYQYETYFRIDETQLQDTIPIDRNNLPMISDTTSKDYDYKLLGDQITLIDAGYLPNKLIPDTSLGLKIIYLDKEILKYERSSQKSVKIKTLDDSTLILSYDGFNVDYVYHKIDSKGNIATQEDTKQYILKLAN